jgi:hypothetical protein
VEAARAAQRQKERLHQLEAAQQAAQRQAENALLKTQVAAAGCFRKRAPSSRRHDG